MDTYAELAHQRKLEAVSIYLDQIAELTLTAFTGIKISLHLGIKAHQKIGLIEKISPIKLYTKVKKSIEKNTNIRYNLIDEN